MLVGQEDQVLGKMGWELSVKYRLAVILCWRIDAICNYLASSCERTDCSCEYPVVISARHICCCLVSGLMCADSKLFCAKNSLFVMKTMGLPG
jgi:hypothetical protein